MLPSSLLIPKETLSTPLASCQVPRGKVLMGAINKGAITFTSSYEGPSIIGDFFGYCLLSKARRVPLFAFKKLAFSYTNLFKEKKAF